MANQSRSCERRQNTRSLAFGLGHLTGFNHELLALLCVELADLQLELSKGLSMVGVLRYEEEVGSCAPRA